MRFLCDMGVSRKVSRWLNQQGHESSHLGLVACSDCPLS